MPTIYWIRKFITVFVRACYCSLSGARWNHFITPYPISLTSILILFSHICLDLSGGLSPPGFPSKSLYAFIFYPLRHSLVIFFILLRVGWYCDENNGLWLGLLDLLAHRLQVLLITLNYNVVDVLHNFQFTVAHALGFSVFTSRLLATDFNTKTSTSNNNEVSLLFLLQSLWNLGTETSSGLTPSAYDWLVIAPKLTLSLHSLLL
jgi:hypothetical protein